MESGSRGELLDRLTAAIMAVSVAHPARIAVDGPDAAGKTTLADELAAQVRAGGREVIRASIDGFHRPREQRYRRGELSAEGCYHDTFDHDALCRVLLDPLGPDGDRRYRPVAFDHRTDIAVSVPPTTASADAMLLFDGVFLLRPELIDRWELRILVSVTPEATLARARGRDLGLFGSAAEVERRYRNRYLPAQRLYDTAARPIEHADIIVYNDDPQHPSWAVRSRR